MSRDTTTGHAGRLRRWRPLLVLLALFALLGPPAAGPAPAPVAAAGGSHHNERVCGDPGPGQAACFAIRQVNDGASPAVTTTTPGGYGPTDLQTAYNLTAASLANGIGQTIAIIDAYDDPKAESDLATYRAHFGLPACTTANGCFRKINQYGAASPLPRADAGWAGEIALDLDMASAICPNCKLLLVEANSAYFSDLGPAFTQAVRQGARIISNSYGGSESSNTSSIARLWPFRAGQAA